MKKCVIISLKLYYFSGGIMKSLVLSTFLMMFLYSFNVGAYSDSEIYTVIDEENTSKFAEMMAAGIEVDEPDLDGNTPLMIASALGKDKFVRYLIDMGADVKRRNYVGVSALHRAAHGGHNDVIDLLLDNGAIINIPDMDGITPLMSAVSADRRFTVELLVHRGAIISFKNVKGHDALDIAKRKRYGKIVSFLTEALTKPVKETKTEYSWDN